MVVRLIVFLSSANLICRSTDISKCFIESLGVWDIESRLYMTFDWCDNTLLLLMSEFNILQQLNLSLLCTIVWAAVWEDTFWYVHLYMLRLIWIFTGHTCLQVLYASLSDSVGCPSDWRAVDYRFNPTPSLTSPAVLATLTQVNSSHSTSHSLPSANSRSAAVSFWRKNVHNTG